jgi:hypothetical protein
MAKKKPQGKTQRKTRSRKTDDSDMLADLIAPMRKVVEDNKKFYVERHEYRDATTADFKGRDRKWYDKSTRELEGLGYRSLGDVVDETIAQAAGLVVPVRRFASADGNNMVAIYQFLQGSGFMKIDLHVCDVESEFTDGSFLATSNAEATAGVSMPPQILGKKYPADTTIVELVRLHEEDKQKLLKRKPKLRHVEIRTAADCDAAQHRQEAIKAAFRQGIGYVDPAEIRRMAGQQMPDDPALADLTAATAEFARQEARLKEKVPAVTGLLSQMLGGGEEKATADLAQLAVAAMLQQQPDVPAEKRDEIAKTMATLFSSTGDDDDDADESAGLKNLVTLMGQLEELEPEDKKKAKRDDFKKEMARAQAGHEKRQTAHVKKRLAKGLSKKAGTGKAEPEILIHGVPVGEIDFKDKPGRTLTAMINEINASKARRDAKVLAKLPLGHSRVGGLPDLPPDRPWPKHKGKRIPFIAQLNLADFPKAAHPLLPDRGHLYAFALISNDKKHWPPPAVVFFYDGDTKSLVREKIPADDEIWEDWAGERVYEILPATAKPKGRNVKKRSSQFGETLGWLQGEMDEVFGTPGEIADDGFQDGNDWINLLAVMSDGSMQWSDCGHLYFLIRRSAMKKHDFSNVIAMACSS